MMGAFAQRKGADGMSAAEQIRKQIEQQLRDAGLQVCPAWERTAFPELESAAAVIGAAKSEREDGALWNYLGLAWDEGQGAMVERYGKRLNAEIFVDLYAPRDQVQAVEQALQTLEEALMAPLCPGLSILSLQRGEICCEDYSRYLKCRCILSCAAYFTQTRDEDGALLTDFILKGVVQ